MVILWAGCVHLVVLILFEFIQACLINHKYTAKYKTELHNLEDNAVLVLRQYKLGILKS